MKLSWKLINEVINKRKTETELPDAFKEKKNSRENTRNIINFAIYLEKSNVDSVFLDPVTEREIEIELKQLKIDKSCS